MPNLGFPELLVILMILVLVFGASRLPAIGEGIGRTIRSFKRGLSSEDSIEVDEAPDEKPERKAQKASDSERARLAESRSGGDQPAEADIVEGETKRQGAPSSRNS